jgi:hypothetical protein
MDQRNPKMCDDDAHEPGPGSVLYSLHARRRTTRTERDKYGDAALLATEPWRQAAGSGTEEQRGNIRDRGRAHTVADSGQRLGDDPAILRLEIWCHACDSSRRRLIDIAAPATIQPTTGGSRYNSRVPSDCRRRIRLSAAVATLPGQTVGRPGWRHYLAYAGDTPIASAAMYVSGEAAWCGFAATDAAHRKRGAQRALVVRRLLDAAAVGCSRVSVETAEDALSRTLPHSGTCAASGSRSSIRDRITSGLARSDTARQDNDTRET